MMTNVQKFRKLEQDFSFRAMFDIICDNGEKTAALYSDNDNTVKISYTAYKKAVHNAAFILSNLLSSSNTGRYVGLIVDNCPEWFILFWGILMAGFKPILLDCLASDETISNLLHESNALAAVNMREQSLPPDIILINSKDILNEGCNTPCGWKPVWANEMALCTSGTTALPKIYVYDGHSAGMAVKVMENYINTPSKLLPEGDARILAFLPFRHVFGFFAVFLPYLMFGKTIVYLKDRSPKTIMETCRRHKVTHIYAVPLFWNNLASSILKKVSQLKQEEESLKKLCELGLDIQKNFGRDGQEYVYKKLFGDFHKNLLGQDLQVLISGGARILPETLRILNSTGLHLVCGFGMTEAAITSVELDSDIVKRLNSSLGKPFSYLEYKIVPVQGDTEANTGEVYVKGESLHSGRLRNGEYLPPSTDDDGWLATGDIGTIGADGSLYLHSRIKDVIINESGENVYPDELEEAFSNLSGVLEHCILGIKNKDDYEDITLVLNMGENIENTDMLNSLSSMLYGIINNMPIFKRVKRILLTQNPLPSVSGIKIHRQKLKSMIESSSVELKQLNLKPVESAREMVAVSLENDAEIVNIEKVTYASIRDEVRGLFAQALGVSPESIDFNAHFINDLGGDSLQSIELLSSIEEKFDISIPDSEYYSCNNVNDISRLLVEKLYNIRPETSENSEKPGEKMVQIIGSFEDSREYKAFAERLKGYEKVGNPYFICHDSVIRDTSIVDDKEVLNFGSYNYIGISGHPKVVKAYQDAASKYGTSASGSRLITGEKRLYRELEAELAKWKHTEDCLVLVSGHATNVTFVGNFCNEHDLIIYDALSHNSILQGCQLSKSESKAFPHNDYRALEKILKHNRAKYEKVLVVVEGAYSMDGDIAPIPEFVKLKKEYKFFLMADEAHSACVIGETGRGIDEYFNLEPDDIDIKMGTLSKGFGTCGGYLAGKKALIDYLRYYLPGFVFSVGIEPPKAAAVLTALRILQEDNSPVQKLHRNISIFIDEAHKRNFNTCLAMDSAVIPILVGGDEEAFVLSNLLLKEGVYVPPVVYPAVPKNQSRLRFCVTSNHKEEQIVYALDKLKEIAKQNNINLPGQNRQHKK